MWRVHTAPQASGANQRERDDAEKSAKVDKIYGGGVGAGDGSGRWNQGDFALVSASVRPDYPRALTPTLTTPAPQP